MWLGYPNTHSAWLILWQYRRSSYNDVLFHRSKKAVDVESAGLNRMLFEFSFVGVHSVPKVLPGGAGSLAAPVDPLLEGV